MFDIVESVIIRLATVYAGLAAYQTNTVWPLVIPLIWMIRIVYKWHKEEPWSRLKDIVRKERNEFIRNMGYNFLVSDGKDWRFRFGINYGVLGRWIASPIAYSCLGAAMDDQKYTAIICSAITLRIFWKIRSMLIDLNEDQEWEADKRKISHELDNVNVDPDLKKRFLNGDPISDDEAILLHDKGVGLPDELISEIKRRKRENEQ